MQLNILNRNLLIAFTLLLSYYHPASAQNSSTDSISHYALQSDSLLNAGNYAQNLNICIRLLELSENKGDCAQISDAKKKVGIAYDYLLDRTNALNWLLTSYREAEKCGSDSTAWRALRYIGGVYFGLNVVDSSRYYLHKSLDKMLSSENHDEIASNYGMLGELYSRLLADKLKAKEYYLLSLEFAKKSGNASALGFAHFRYGMYLIKAGDCIGKTHCDSAYSLFENVNDVEGILYSLNGLAFSAITCGEPFEIYSYLNSKEVLKDSLFHKQMSAEAARYGELYEKRKKELAIAQLENDNKNKNYLLLTFGILLFALIIVGYLVLNRRKIIQEKKRVQELNDIQLERFKDVLEAEEKERIRIARELHDSIGYLLSAGKMNLSNIDTSKENENTEVINKVVDIIDEASKEVRAISHNLMPSALTELGLHSALKQLINKLNQKEIKDIEFIYEISSQIDSETEINIYRIIQELINNCVKHAAANKMILKIAEDDEGIFIEYYDNGRGIENTNNKTIGGIGWKNIHSRVEMMKGKIAVSSNAHSGTNIHITKLRNN